MLIKLILIFSSIALAWSYPLGLEIQQNHQNEERTGMISQKKMPEVYDIISPPYYKPEYGLANHLNDPESLYLHENQDLEILKKGKGKSKPKAKPKGKPKSKPKGKPKSKPKGKGKGKKHPPNGLSGSVTWKHGGLTVHGHKEKHHWGISIHH